MPVIRLDHCPDAILRASRAFAGTGTFLSVAPGELKMIVVVEGVVIQGSNRACNSLYFCFGRLPGVDYVK